MIGGAPLSQHWYRVSALKPKLRAHVDLQRQVLRGQIWYVLADRATGRQFRFTPSAYEFIGRLDGVQTVTRIYEQIVQQHGETALSSDEVIALISTLYSADALVADVAPEANDLLQRGDSFRQQQRASRWANPLALRLALWDPDAWLGRVAPHCNWVFSRLGLCLWLLVVGGAGFALIQHWQELNHDLTDRVLSPGNLLLLSLLYPVVKALHELGHAMATKVWGGEVHEVGVLLLVLMPAPYVDASASNAFRCRYQRLFVAAAGMMVELFLAALALGVWLNVEPGILRSCAFNVIFIAGLSTVVFNGNPLLRFDGYYMLVDLIGLPNLAQRANKYLAYLLQRYLFGARALATPAAGLAEGAWCVCYGIGSWICRTSVAVGVIWFVADRYFLAGVGLAIWAIAMQWLLPAWRAGRALLRDAQTRGVGSRARWVCGALLVGTTMFYFGLPLPLTTVAEGVVAVPERAEVRAGADGTVRKRLVSHGAEVRTGQPLLELEDPYIAAQVRLLETERQEVLARLQAAQEQRVEVQLLEEKLRHADANLQRARDQQADLVIVSPGTGRLILPDAEDLEGRFLHQGDTVAYLRGAEALTVQVVIPQERAGLVREHTDSVSIRLAEHLGPVVSGRILQSAPAASNKLPHKALGTEAGGVIPVDPNDKDGLTALRPVFTYEIALPEELTVVGLGGRVYARFNHGRETLAQQSLRLVRQLLLAKFSV
jgi:putative peptide zinc metalloprotease protein